MARSHRSGFADGLTQVSSLPAQAHPHEGCDGWYGI